MLDLPYQTLHCHTSRSDGVLSPQQVLDECQKNSIGVVAFTDHDSLMGAATLEKLKKLNHPVKFVSGIEISCDIVDEVPEKIQLFHITGLFVDPTNKPLGTFCQELSAGRRRRLAKFVSNLTELGFKVTEDEVMNFVKGDSVGRPHIVSALQLHPENQVILNRFFTELKEKAKTDQLRRRQLAELESRGNDSWRQWFTLVMTKDALHSVYVDYQEDESLTMDKAVALIRGASGLALLAHWSFCKQHVPSDLVEKFCQEKRLDGLETVYAFGMPEEQMAGFRQDMQLMNSLCKKYNLVAGGGGDFHQPVDFTSMVDPKLADLAEQTIGMTEHILDLHPNLDLSWSSLSR